MTKLRLMTKLPQYERLAHNTQKLHAEEKTFNKHNYRPVCTAKVYFVFFEYKSQEI